MLGSLQAVEDALDDPFDGISEDDINLDQVLMHNIVVMMFKQLACWCL